MEWPAHPPLEGGGGCVIYILLKCIFHDNLFSAFVFRHFIYYFFYKVLLSGLIGLYRVIIALVRQDILFRGPKLGR